MHLYTPIIIFTLLASFAWVMLIYRYFAETKDWWISKMLISDTSMVKLIAYLALPGAAISSAFLTVWWSAIIVVALGLVLSFLFIALFRSSVQHVALLGLLICWVIGMYLLFEK